MNKQKFQIGLILCLAISNIFLGIYIFNNRNTHGPNPERPKKIIIEKLHFDEHQINAYEVLIKEHRRQINEQDYQIMKLKNELYSHLSMDENAALTDSITHKVADIQQEIERIHYAHFMAIKKLCKPEQKRDFDALSAELAKIFSHKPPPPKR